MTLFATLRRWSQTAHGRVLLLGIGWLAVLPALYIAIQVSGGEQAGWALLGYLALWTYASPLVGLAGLVLALVVKAPEGSGKARTAGIAVHAVIIVVGVALIFNASRGA